MKTKTIISYIGLALLAALAVTLWTLDCGPALAGGTCAGLALAALPLVLTEDSIKEFQGILGEIKEAGIKSVPGSIKSLQEATSELRNQVSGIRRSVL